MNRDLKIRLIRKAPLFFKKELRKLSSEYIKRDNLLFVPKEEDSNPEYTLVDVVADSFDEKFLEYIENRFGVVFRVDEDTPYALLHNPRFLDYMAKKHPGSIFYFPNEMITDEHVRICEDNSSYVDYSIIPPKLIQSRIILDKYIDIILNEDLYGKASLLAKLFNACLGDKGKENYIINKMGDRFYNEFLDSKLYEQLPYDMQCNEKIIDVIIETDIFDYDLIPYEKKDYSKKFIIDKIERNEIDSLKFGMYHWTSDLYSEKDIFFVLLKKEMSRHTDEEVDLKYLYTHDFYNMTLPIIVELFLKNFTPDIETLTTGEKYSIYRILKVNALHHNNLFIHTLGKSKDLFEYMVDRNLDIDYSDFYSLEIDDEVAIKILSNCIDHIKYKKYAVVMPNISVLKKAYSKKEVLKGFLSKVLSVDKIENIEYVISYLCNFDRETYTKENLEILFQIFDKYPNMDSIFVSRNNSNDKELLRKFLELKRFESISKFSEQAYDADNIVISLIDTDMKNLFNSVKDRNKIEAAINSITPEEAEEMLINAIKVKKAFVLLALYRNKNLGIYNSPKFEELRPQFEALLKDTLVSQDVIDKILNGERKVVNADYITNDSLKYYFNNFGDITTSNEQDFISDFPISLLEKINRKQFISILKDVERIDKATNPAMVALNMYLTLGFARSKDVLNPNEGKNYGKVDGEQLYRIFGNLNTRFTTFTKEGNGYAPVLNEELLNTIFGKNYKVLNTPFRNYIGGYKEKAEEKNRLIERVKQDLTLTPEQRETKIKTIEDNYASYKREIDKFMSNLGDIFYNWDIIEEEFLKKKNKSKLDLKLNVEVINEIATVVKDRIKRPVLEARDEPLERTDIFDYVGRDTQYTYNPSEAPKRAITLSRMMEANKDKKFPHIVLSRGKMKLETYGPSDRDILTAGYKSGCCFRPNGNADNNGKDFSLLTYCTTNEYGGGLKIVDERGRVKMFTPILRNGNVLMLHSIETKGLTPEESIEVHELLKEYATKVLEMAAAKGDKIDFVTITNLHHLNDAYVVGELIGDKKFRIYDPESKFKGMYNNLNCCHMILAKREGVTVDDVRYDYPIEISYESPKEDYIINISIDDQDELSFYKLDILKMKYASLTEQRQVLLKSGKKEEAYALANEMKETKKAYLAELKNVSKRNNGLDKYSIYNRVKPLIEKITKDNRTLMPVGIRKAIVGGDWYIVVNKDGLIIGDTTNKGNEEYERYFAMITESLPGFRIYHDGITDPQEMDMAMPEASVAK